MADKALMPFRLRDHWFMLHASVVKEVLGVQPWLVVPHTNTGLLGLCNWRGRAIPVLNLPSLLGLGSKSNDGWHRTLVIECQGNIVAVPVNEARAVIKVDVALCRPAHVTSLPFTELEVDNGQEVMGIVDLHAMVGHLLGQTRATAGGESGHAATG